MIIKPRPQITSKYWMLWNRTVPEYLFQPSNTLAFLPWTLFETKVEDGVLMMRSLNHSENGWIKKTYSVCGYIFEESSGYRQATPEEIDQLGLL